MAMGEVVLGEPSVVEQEFWLSLPRTSGRSCGASASTASATAQIQPSCWGAWGVAIVAEIGTRSAVN